MKELDDLEGEVWKFIEGYDYYLVSNLGRVKSIDREVIRFPGKPDLAFRHGRFYEGRIEKDRKNAYLRVGLSVNSKEKIFSIHRLVCEAFIDNPNKYDQINHIDCNKQNNVATNLEWVSGEMNRKHAIDNNLIDYTRLNKQRFTNEEVLDIRYRYSIKETINSIARVYGVDRRTVYYVVSGRSYKHVI